MMKKDEAKSPPPAAEAPKRKYIFYRQLNVNNRPERFEKTEEELQPVEKDILLETLVKTWDNTPPDMQEKFYNALSFRINEAQQKKGTPTLILPDHLNNPKKIIL